jgi:hypothetical protein
MSPIHAYPDFLLMGRIESVVARNLQDYVGAYRHVVPQAGAACIEVAGGVAAFTGLGSPLTTVKGTGARVSPLDLHQIESFFRDRNAATVTIEMAPWPGEEVPQILGERGYSVAGQEDVMATTSGASLRDTAVPMAAVPSHAWAELLRRCSELPDESAANELVTAASCLPHAQLYGVREKDRWIACAQSVTYDEVVIFGNDGTLREARGKATQTALIEERLRTLPAGKIAIAEVAPGSGSERNYLRCGFQIAYARTHYVRTLH